jgi:SAM-dependent MidA family methyltransferase
MRRRNPDLLDVTRLHLVEASAAARAAQEGIVRESFHRRFSSSASLPESFDGVLVANELLDAFPVHQVVMREDGLGETYVGCRATLSGSPALETLEGPPSTPQLAEYLARLGVSLEVGWRVEINLKAVDWVRGAARRLRRGFMILIDYGHEAGELYSATHAAGTLTSFTRHTSSGAEAEPAWLRQPGEQDITAHVDFTSVRAAAEAEGMTTLAFLDQTYFVLGLMPHLEHVESQASAMHSRNLQLKTLLMPGGLGSTMKVLILGKGVGTPALRGCSYRMRVT